VGCGLYDAVLRPSVCRLSVTYVLWLNGASLRKTLKKQIWNCLWGIECSRDRWPHVSLKGPSRDLWHQYAHGSICRKQLEMLFSNTVESAVMQ